LVLGTDKSKNIPKRGKNPLYFSSVCVLCVWSGSLRQADVTSTFIWIIYFLEIPYTISQNS
ncbi:MAG: hypothetical protein ACYT04_89650, partial [Nostoc sp.]